MAYDFDGTTATGLATTVIPNAFPVSIHAWVNADTLAAIGGVFSGCSVSTANHLMAMQVGTAGSTCGATLNDGTTALNITGGAPTTGTWMSLGARFTSSAITLYLNGAQVATSAHTKAFPSIGRFNVGCRQNGSSTLTSILNGRVGEVAVWSGDIGAEGMASLAAGWSPLSVRPNLLTAYYPLISTLIGAWGGATATQIGSGSATVAAHGMPLIRPGAAEISVPMLAQIDAAAVLGAPTAAGSLTVGTVSAITGAATIPPPLAAGTLVTRSLLSGAASIPAPSAAGALNTRSILTGAASLPAPVADGELVLRALLSGVVVLPAPTAEGSLVTLSQIAGAAVLPPPVAAGLIGGMPPLGITGAAVLPPPIAAGALNLLSQIVGAAVLPAPTAAGTLVVPQQAQIGPYEDMHQRVRIEAQPALLAAGLDAVTLWPNEAADGGAGPKIPAGTLWCEVQINDVSTRLVAWGTDHLYRKHGELRFVLRQSANLGDAELLERIDLLRPFFREKTVNGVRFGMPRLERGGRDESGERAQWRHDLVCPFFSDDAVTATQRQVSTGWATGVTRQAVHNAVRKRFRRDVAAAHSLPTAYDNAQFVPPSSGPWCVFSVQTGDETLGAMGRMVGIATAMLFTPVGVGEGIALAMADRIALAFRSVHEAGVSFETPELRTIGRSGPYHQVNVTIRFRSLEGVS